MLCFQVKPAALHSGGRGAGADADDDNGGDGGGDGGGGDGGGGESGEPHEVTQALLDVARKVGRCRLTPGWKQLTPRLLSGTFSA